MAALLLVARITALLVAVAALVGCGDDGASEVNTIRVAVSTNLAIPTELDALHLIVERDGNTAFDRDYSLDVSAADAGATVTLPDTLLLHNAEPRTDTGDFVFSQISVEVTGLLAATPRIVRRAVLSSRTDRPVLLRLRLCDDCVDVLDCSCTSTECNSCKASGSCESAAVSIDSLPEDDGSQSLEGEECP